jgi:hypothetical protein
MGDTREETGRIKLPDHSQPSDYMDVQPRTYDPEFISQISSKMQVPDRIALGGSEYNRRQNGFVHHDLASATQFVGMTVPDRIVLAGENNHIALRQDLILDLPGSSSASESLSYVGLLTPPRNLTLEERFPVVEDTDDHKMLAANGDMAGRDYTNSNGHAVGPLPYDPGVNLHDSVLLNEENEVTLVRTQVAKLSRRVHVIEEDNQKRATRELVMYPLILGYFMWKILSWIIRDR